MQLDQEIAPIFKEKEIDPHLLNQLDRNDIDLLVRGKFTGLIKDYELPDGRLKDGKIRLSRNQNGEINVEFAERKSELIIDDVPILGKKLKEEDITRLKNGEIISLKHKGTELYLKVDNELNQVTVHSAKQIGIVNSLGGYVFTATDKEMWLQHEKLEPRIFFNKENNSYFQARIRLREDGKGIEYHDYQSIPHSKAPDLIKKYNFDKGLSNMANLTLEAIGSNKLNASKTNSQESITLSDENFQRHLDQKNYAQLRAMSSNGYRPSPEKLNEALSKTCLTEQEKRDALVALKVKPSEFIIKSFKKGDQVLDTTTNQPVQIIELHDNRIATVKNTVGEAYKIGIDHIQHKTALHKIQTQQKAIGLPKKSPNISH